MKNNSNTTTREKDFNFFFFFFLPEKWKFILKMQKIKIMMNPQVHTIQFQK